MHTGHLPPLRYSPATRGPLWEEIERANEERRSEEGGVQGGRESDEPANKEKRSLSLSVFLIFPSLVLEDKHSNGRSTLHASRK